MALPEFSAVGAEYRQPPAAPWAVEFSPRVHCQFGAALSTEYVAFKATCVLNYHRI